MNIKDIISRIESIADDASCVSGCSHSDALQEGLHDVEQELLLLAKELSEMNKEEEE